jgi:hypothetical protein
VSDDIPFDYMDEEIAREEEGEPIDFGEGDFDIDPDMGDH